MFLLEGEHAESKKNAKDAKIRVFIFLPNVEDERKWVVRRQGTEVAPPDHLYENQQPKTDCQRRRREHGACHDRIAWAGDVRGYRHLKD
jgi:hypothetical protein